MLPNSPGEESEAGMDHGLEVATGIPIADAQRILQMMLANLPDEAQSLIRQVDREIARLQEQTEIQIANIREQAEQQMTEIQNHTDSLRQGLLEAAIKQLEPLQKELFRTGQADQFLATFIQIQALRARIENVLPNPGTLVNFEHIGKIFHFRVTGQTQAPIWGTDIYTSDSALATAAIHAGALEEGEEGIVRVTMVDMAGLAIKGSYRNGVKSLDWGPYHVGYRVVRA